ncbi:SpoIIE family protein phosphatase [Jatrophihabitans sp. YIM 134969]
MTNGTAGARPRVARDAVFEVLPTPYVVLSADLRVLDMNSEYLRVTGRSRAELLERNFLEAFPPPEHTLGPDGRSELQTSLEKVVATGERDTLPVQKYPIADPDGRMVERHWLAVHVPVLDADGRVVAVVQRTEDITEFARERERVEALAVEGGDDAWRRRAERVEADLFVRARELADALAAKDAVARQLAAQADVALALTNATDFAEVEAIVVGRGLPVLGVDGGGIVTPDPDGGWRITVNDALGEHTQATYPSAPWDSMIPGCWSARTGQRLLLPNREAGHAYDAEVMAGIYETTGRSAWALIPMAVGDVRLGSLAAAWIDDHELDQDELDLLDAFAAQCAQALLRIRTAEEQEAALVELQQLAESLQRALLTPPPQPDGLQVAVRYRSAGHHAQVGGDWYDALVTPSGETVLVIGDVVGHDSAAAAAMGQLRGVLRTLAYDADRGGTADTPAAILTRLEHAAVGLAVDTMATLVLARIDPADPAAGGSRRMHWSNAGHPLPVLVHADGRVEVLDTKPDILIGVAADAERHDHTVDLPPGSTLLGYTDGLVERRDLSQEIGLDRLREVLAPLAGLDLDALLDALLAELAPEPGEDDTALLAVRVTGTPASGPGDLEDAAAVDLPFSVDAPAVARAFVADRAASLPEDVRSDAVVLVSELASNAVRHGAPGVCLQVRVDPDRLVVAVHDAGDRLPVTPGVDHARASGRGLLITAALADAWGVLDADASTGGRGKTVWFELRH